MKIRIFCFQQTRLSMQQFELDYLRLFDKIAIQLKTFVSALGFILSNLTVTFSHKICNNIDLKFSLKGAILMEILLTLIGNLWNNSTDSVGHRSRELKGKELSKVRLI